VPPITRIQSNRYPLPLVLFSHKAKSLSERSRVQRPSPSHLIWLGPPPWFRLDSELRFIWPNFAFRLVKLKKLYSRSVVDDEGDRNTLRWAVRLYQYFLARDGSPNVINEFPTICGELGVPLVNRLTDLNRVEMPLQIMLSDGSLTYTNPVRNRVRDM
jgi:hypothetical protein